MPLPPNYIPKDWTYDRKWWEQDAQYANRSDIRSLTEQLMGMWAFKDGLVKAAEELSVTSASTQGDTDCLAIVFGEDDGPRLGFRYWSQQSQSSTPITPQRLVALGVLTDSISIRSWRTNYLMSAVRPDSQWVSLMMGEIVIFDANVAYEVKSATECCVLEVAGPRTNCQEHVGRTQLSQDQWSRVASFGAQLINPSLLKNKFRDHQYRGV